MGKSVRLGDMSDSVINHVIYSIIRYFKSYSAFIVVVFRELLEGLQSKIGLKYSYRG